MTFIGEAFSWLTDATNWSGPAGIPSRVAEHLLVVLIVVLLAALIAWPIGLFIGHTRRGGNVAQAITGGARAVPTLGLLTLFGLVFGIGLFAPIVALVILAIPSLLAGAYSGVQAIDESIPSAAKAVGMTPLQVLASVEIPLALPLIIGGLRTATLQVVATATMAAYTADAGLGRYLFAGLKTRDYGEMLGGALLVVLIALILELALGAIQRASASRP